MTAVCDDGAAAVRSQDYERAEKLLAACTQSGAATLESFLMLAGLHQARKDERALLATAREGLKRFPDEKRFYLTAGAIAGRGGQFDDAVAVMEMASARWPDDPKVRSLLESALVGRGTNHLDKGANAKAAEDLNRAVALAPADAEAWMNLGRARHNLLRYSDSLNAFDRVLKLQPSTALLQFHRGLAHYSLGDFTGTIADLNAQIAADASYFPAYLVRGLARLSLGDPEAALPDLETAAENMPDNAQAHDALGRALLRLQSLPGAERHLRKAVELDPQNPGYANTLVSVLVRLGKLEEARELSRKAAQLARERR
jgi:tetratricopeptide (TPR) repeat protein